MYLGKSESRYIRIGQNQQCKAKPSKAKKTQATASKPKQSRTNPSKARQSKPKQARGNQKAARGYIKVPLHQAQPSGTCISP